LSSKLQDILELLGDGKFHGLDELQVRTRLSEKQAREVVAFLTEYGFAEMNRQKTKIRVSKDAKRLLTETAT
jgi:hypothetical protein